MAPGSMMTAITLDHFLRALYAGAPRSAFIEVRYRRGLGMGQSFIAADRLCDVADAIATRSAYTDCHLGVIPRRRRGGGRADLVARASVLWADCDTSDSIAALIAFSPPPSITVRSGTADHLHCYWLLSHAADLEAIERGNRKLAHALGADMQCTDSPRVLRPPWSRNWKHDPPVSVSVARWRPDLGYHITDVVADLEDPPGRRERVRATPHAHAAVGSDSLLDIEPAVYVEALTGTAVPAHGKIACPFHHEDRTPSLHVYREPERGWYCYGCGRGGSIYDFAAALWLTGQSDAPLRGEDFLELRGRLSELFGVARSFGHDWP